MRRRKKKMDKVLRPFVHKKASGNLITGTVFRAICRRLRFGTWDRYKSKKEGGQDPMGSVKPQMHPSAKEYQHLGERDAKDSECVVIQK